MARAADPRSKITVDQLRILLEAVEDDSSLYNAGNSDMISFLNIDKWTNLASRLNECPDGAYIPVQNWKFVLRYWSENTRKRREMSKAKRASSRHLSISREEAKELEELEERLFEFMKKESSMEYVDVTYVGKFGGEPPNEDGTAGSGGVKFVVQLLNVFEGREPDENTCPRKGPKKRTIVMKDADDNPRNMAKKFKIIYDENVDEGEDPDTYVYGHQLGQLQDVSRDIQDHITTIQSRIHMIKDLWKHRCGDN
ncbi:uncharacterized protein LOC110369759 [Helicoverpa armigera]|uniref:uncharacterized protein LOC110369759 n=1 Tax=Helicoverpa armigera TaxID=29058 RepID=UPI000B3A1DFF|nr:uncharacterized protein LOC124631343 [Helicoverpa zea]